MKKRMIAYVTGTRADFGLMTDILRSIESNPKLQLRIWATGMHLMKEFGHTYKEVKRLFPHVQTINAYMKGDSQIAMSRYLADCTKAIVLEFARNRPDIALVLGDRAEMLAVANASLYLRIPVVHIHGGDTSGTIDEVTRHVITKLSSVHFPATKEAGRLVEKLGEEKWRIHVVGAPSVDAVRKKRNMSRAEMSKYLGIPPSQKYILVTVHPDTTSIRENGKNIRIVLRAVESFQLPIVIIYPNADPGNSSIIKAYESKMGNSVYRIFKSMPYDMFFNIEKYASVWVGNSSAGVIESASFHIPVVNIGMRQAGRTMSKNIRTVNWKATDIKREIHKALTDKAYLRMIARVRNPWGDGNASKRIIDTLANIKIDNKLLTKRMVA